MIQQHCGSPRWSVAEPTPATEFRNTPTLERLHIEQYPARESGLREIPSDAKPDGAKAIKAPTNCNILAATHLEITMCPERSAVT